MTCPACDSTVTNADLRIDGTIGVCPRCARSLVNEKRTLRLATAEDIKTLMPSQITDLRHARPTAWRNDVRARHNAIIGGRG